MLVQRRRDSRAALRLMRKLLRKQGFTPKLLVTDKLRSYASAFRCLRLTCPHEQGGGLLPRRDGLKTNTEQRNNTSLDVGSRFACRAGNARQAACTLV